MLMVCYCQGTYDVETLVLLQYEIKLAVTMIVTVIDVNDPPVFANLPGQTTIPEVNIYFRQIINHRWYYTII